ncbi:gamma-glutamyl-gamma-aminobutyrate hydrolase family protein [Nocardioides marmorisolisilvae]|uniref:Gamma-glutamyl-gamma-aminobutyrate hydrolase family protein n=1 Tax=Nocardioides marmorisolisilvae TaxID=1542737 RepID=A0A3N0DZT6_9ACTN|nr:gamma-glutamyl-gamma-aminobutyrate hydrolase family protein [Nocardioides marmorisolisilvae]RNL81125.1 gamma-glutamyl-gamma-aminobutyrate hydrolase family protein [Nocardioides marmorisolisilvae]
MTRPLIGLSTYREQARWGVWDQPADLLPSDYALAVEAAGGTPVLLPPSLPYAESAAAVVTRLDGLVISGGADVDPARYGEDALPTTFRPRPDRDAWEWALLDAAYGRDLPVLGVCRGMQVMAVHAGGTLDQHVPDLIGTETHDPGGDTFGDTTVRVAPGSRLETVLGGAEPVACHHHQSVREHPGFTAVAWADDGLLEAMEAPGDTLRIAVQWHPEVRADRGLFKALVEAAS